jgi:GST-like protein
MITLYTWTTPNGRKASIMLEEIGADYAVKPVDLGQDEQFDPAFLALSPNNKIPAIVDPDGEGGERVVFETGAILTYLAEKSGRFLASSGRRRDEALEWLFWSSSSLSPMLGQWNYFVLRAPEKVPPAIERFTKESVRLFGVLEKRLAAEPYLAGEYSIADIATFTWVNAVGAKLKEHASDLGDTPSIDRWLQDIEARPAVQRGMAVPKL